MRTLTECLNESLGKTLKKGLTNFYTDICNAVGYDASATKRTIVNCAKRLVISDIDVDKIKDEADHN